jgi:hypothetical protein
MYSHDKCEKEDEYEVDDGLCLGDSQTSFLLNQSDKGLLESAESVSHFNCTIDFKAFIVSG